MLYDLLGFPFGLSGFFDGPRQGLSQHFFGDGAAGLADGRQRGASPFIRPARVHLGHQQTVHYDYEIHVPGQALACT